MKSRLLTVIGVVVLAAATAHAAETARGLYEHALALEQTVRADGANPTRAEIRKVIAAYEAVVRAHPTSGYCDNALWQGAELAGLAFDRFKDPADKATARRLLRALTTEYPSSTLVARARAELEDAATADAPTPPSNALADPEQPRIEPAAAVAPVSNVTLAAGPNLLRQVQRMAMPDGIRLVIGLDSEAQFHEEEIDHPRRLFFDLKNVKAVPSLQDATLKFDGDLVKEIRLGRHPGATRVVVDLDGVSGYDVYPLYGPYRLIVDLHRASTGTAPAPAVRSAAPPPAVPAGPAAADGVATPVGAAVNTSVPDVKPWSAAVSKAPAPKASLPVVSDLAEMTHALPPATNSNGKFSLSRQLGLSVSRIVIDAGHGGHDPGAQGNGINEADLTLDVAQRLKTLLGKQPGIEVVMTRDSDVFIPLQERTEIANRENADLFLSIHANASRNTEAHGIETYFLNFAMNPEAEAVAARENAASGQPMHALPDIVKAIALNNKIKESRDFAATVQRSMVKRLAAKNHHLRDLGVKQAPFVVLIGATMPSVLAEISFLTNKQDGTLLKTGPYRQQVAQALCDAVLKYQQALTRTNASASKKATY
jgi:N-acetylmuramoyl-L-alanine amidase